jgi:hypothetical protein
MLISRGQLHRSTAFFLSRTLTMSRLGITKLVAVSGLGVLVLIFGLILLSVLLPTLRPTHTDFVFAISRRTLNVAVVTLSVILAALIFFFARALRRRNLN